MLPPQALHISDTQILKIFPEQYYRKYGKHLEILQLEKRLMEEEQKKYNTKQINFQLRRKQIQEKIPEAIFRQTQIYKFDDYEQKIAKNKEQLKRQMKYASLINMKVKLGPKKKLDQIKAPLQENQELSEKVLERLKAYEDQAYDEELHLKEKYKKIQEEKMKCKFVSKSTRTSPTKIHDPDDPQKNMRKTHNLQIYQIPTRYESPNFSKSSNHYEKTPITKINSKLHLSTHNSRQTPILSRKQKKLKRSLSKSKVLNTSTKNLTQNKSRKMQPKRDLIAETKKIRDIYNSMKTLKRYEELMQYRKIQSIINRDSSYEEEKS